MLPPELGRLSNLELLDLYDNQLSGEIPLELGSLIHLERLSLSENQLSGELPPELGSLSNLQSLDLSDNQLSGEIPPELGSLSNLEWLDLGFNQLSGGIPPELGSLANLQRLFLQRNQLSGCVPQGLSGIPETDLGTLGLPPCETRAAVAVENLPEGGAALAALYEATGGANWKNNYNWLSEAPLGEWYGITTDSIGRMIGLDLSDNQLSDGIPPELGSLPNLQSLDLSGNQLSGEIPPELGSLPNLQWLSLSVNQLIGELPRSLTRLTALQWFLFFNNPGLCAPVDNAFQTWLNSIAEVYGSSCAPMDSPGDRTVLVELHRATSGGGWENSASWLSDRPVREWHGVVTDANGRVTGLFLFSNGLSGEIPPELGSLSNLRSLHLFENQLPAQSSLYPW